MHNIAHFQWCRRVVMILIKPFHFRYFSHNIESSCCVKVSFLNFHHKTPKYHPTTNKSYRLNPPKTSKNQMFVIIPICKTNPLGWCWTQRKFVLEGEQWTWTTIFKKKKHLIRQYKKNDQNTTHKHNILPTQQHKIESNINLENSFH